MFGTQASSHQAMIQLQQLGFKHEALYGFRQQGLTSLQHPTSLIDKTFVFKATPLLEQPYWVCYDQSNPLNELKKRQKPDPIFKQAYGSVIDNTYIKKPVESFIQEKWIPLSGLGLGVSGTSAELYLQIKDYEIFKRAVQQGQFIANWEGRKIWKMGFQGNASVSSAIVRSEKAAFISSLKTMKIVKTLSSVAAVGGVFLSGIEASSKGTTEAWGKFTMDVIMTGVGFIPVVGWVIAGAYFIGDAITSLTGVDWWHYVWSNWLLPTGASIQKAMEAYNYSGIDAGGFIIRNPLGW